MHVTRRQPSRLGNLRGQFCTTIKDALQKLEQSQQDSLSGHDFGHDSKTAAFDATSFANLLTGNAANEPVPDLFL
jgi:hypothetical protein